MTDEQIIEERIRIGNRIAALRKVQNISQVQLATLTGLKQQNIQRIESGKYSTGVDILTRVSNALTKKVEIN